MKRCRHLDAMMVISTFCQKKMDFQKFKGIFVILLQLTCTLSPTTRWNTVGLDIITENILECLVAVSGLMVDELRGDQSILYKITEFTKS